MSFHDALDQWSSRRTIRGAAVVSEDGLLVHDALGAAVDRDAVAALAVTVLRHAMQLGEAAAAGAVGCVVVELAEGPAIVAALDEFHSLVVLAEAGTDLGPLLFDIRREKPALSRVV
jgi:predicted regulator of Ras-like GTPase activity (Roadblock/LC7/MglB family)